MKLGERKDTMAFKDSRENYTKHEHKLTDFQEEETEPSGTYSDEGWNVYGSCICENCDLSFSVGGWKGCSDAEIEWDLDTLEEIG